MTELITNGAALINLLFFSENNSFHEMTDLILWQK